MTFKDLPIGSHFRFVEKTKVGNGIFDLVGIKKSESEYRMGGINRIIGSRNAKVIQTTETLN